MIFDDIILVLKEKPSVDKIIRFKVDSIFSEKTTFTIETRHLQQLREDIINQIEMHAGTVELSYDPNTYRTQIIIKFQGNSL
jgi:hypothetical protein